MLTAARAILTTRLPPPPPVTESFDVPNQGGLAGLDLPWAEPETAWSVVSNTCRTPTDTDGYQAICQTVMPSVDHYSEVDVTFNTAGVYTETGVWVRHDNSASNYLGYWAAFFFFGGNYHVAIFRFNGDGTRDNITGVRTLPGGLSFPVRVRLQAVGSELSLFVDDVLRAYKQNASVPGGVHVGFSGYRDPGGGTDAIILDNFEAGAV